MVFAIQNADVISRSMFYKECIWKDFFFYVVVCNDYIIYYYLPFLVDFVVVM